MRRVLGTLLLAAFAIAALIWFGFERDMRELRARLDGRNQTMETSWSSPSSIVSVVTRLTSAPPSPLQNFTRIFAEIVKRKC